MVVGGCSRSWPACTDRRTGETGGTAGPPIPWECPLTDSDAKPRAGGAGPRATRAIGGARAPASGCQRVGLAWSWERRCAIRAARPDPERRAILTLSGVLS